MGLIRFLRGAKLLGQTTEIPGKSLVEHAYAANVDIPTNCTSGNCGSCMVTLLSGDVSIPEPLTPGFTTTLRLSYGHTNLDLGP
jgi:ferredoxin